MRVIMFYTILIFLSILYSACDNNVIVPALPPEEEIKVLDIEWASLLNNGEGVVSIAEGVVYGGWFISPGDIGDPSTLIAFDQETGDREWEVIFSELEGNDINEMFLVENILIATNGYITFGVDLNTKEVVWSINFRDKNERIGRGIVGENGKYYQSTDLNFDPLGGHTEKLYQIDPYSGMYKEVYSRAPNHEGTKSISPPVLWVHDNSEFMIFNERPNAATTPSITRQELVAMNIESQDTLWRVQVTNTQASNGLHPPVIYDNRIVITGGFASIFGFDILTGEQLWEYAFDYPLAIWNTTGHLIYEDRLYVNNTLDDITCLNPENGELIWNNPTDFANCSDNMLYYEKDDLLVFACHGNGSVNVLDALTGETLHKEHRYANSVFHKDVIYAEDTDMFYALTFKHALGFKIKRPE